MRMEKNCRRDGQMLLRYIVSEYSDLLELLEDPQILSRQVGSFTGGPTSTSSSEQTQSSPESPSKKLAELVSNLRRCYDTCLERENFGFKVRFL